MRKEKTQQEKMYAELGRMIDFDLRDFYRSISRRAAWYFAAVATLRRKSRRNWSGAVERREDFANDFPACWCLAEVQCTRSNKSSTKMEEAALSNWPLISSP